MKTTIMQIIKSNERYNVIPKLYEILSDKYGKLTIAGGALIDCFYDKPFYDVDCFINIKDLKPEWKQKLHIRKDTHVLDVLRDNIDGFDIDIVVIDYSVAKHIRRFDQRFKQAWYDDKGLHMTKGAAKDITDNKVRVGVLNGPAIYFRVIRSARKYGMHLDDTDMWLMENFMSCLDKLRLPKKYQHMKREFLPYKNPDKLLGEIVYKYSQNYWNTKLLYAPSWTTLKLFLLPAIIKHNRNK